MTICKLPLLDYSQDMFCGICFVADDTLEITKITLYEELLTEDK